MVGGPFRDCIRAVIAWKINVTLDPVKNNVKSRGVEKGSHQPSSTYFIYHQYTPLHAKVSFKFVKHLLLAHSHNNIHLSMSRDVYSHTS